MKIHRLTCSAIIALAPLSNAQAITSFLYTQPYAYAISPILVNNPVTPSTPGQTLIRTYDIGITNKTPSWNVSEFTGINIPANLQSTNQRSVDSNWYGSTAIQSYEDRVAFQLHTYSSPFVLGRYLKTINLEYNFPTNNTPTPWSGQYGPNAKLCMGFFAAVPSSWSGDGSDNYAGANFSFRDLTTNKQFTIGSIFFTTLSAEEYIGFDGGQGGTNVPMVATYYGSQNYITTPPGSASIRTSSWNNEVWFGFCLTRQNMENLVNQVNANYPDNNFSIQNLGLGGIHIGSEISTGPSGMNNGHMAIRLKEWNVLIEH